MVCCRLGQPEVHENASVTETGLVSVDVRIPVITGCDAPALKMN